MNYYFEQSNKIWYELWNQRTKKDFFEPKLITLDNASKNSFALDLKGFMGTTTTYSIIPRNDTNIIALLGVLNSELLTFYHIKNTIPQDNGFYRYQKIFIKDLPININYNAFPLETVVLYLLFIKNSFIELDLICEFFNTISNGIVYELYFPEEFQSAGKELLRYLEDIRPITDEMSDEEKLAIIQSEYERLSDPNYPLCNILDTLDTIEEVRVIKEALK